MLCIVARYDDQVIRFPVPAGEFTVGSSSENDLVLPFPGVSRQHATMTPANSGVRVTDRESKNGLVLGGAKVTEALLRPGEAVMLGRASVTLEDARTSDIELGLTVKQIRLAERKSGDTEAGDLFAVGDAAAALRLIRETEGRGPHFSGRRRILFLQRCREVLSAQSLLLCDLHTDGETEILSLAGAIPPDQSLTIARSLVPGRQRAWKSVRRDLGRGAMIVAGRTSHYVVATFTSRPDNWTEDFVAFIAEKLIDSPAAEAKAEAAPQTPQRGPNELVIPESMVIGTSESMSRLLRQVAATVSSKLDVLLLGETGTGKELFARTIHASGPTERGPFLAINCAAIPTELLEAELFGVVGRVATGVDPRTGLFLQANGGSIFLDEIGELPERLQAKLLRVLQEREVLPLGAPAPRKIDVRVISASNRDLAARVKEGTFRADLYYRLRGLQFHIPPLRERKEDIASLVLEFVTRASEEYGKGIRGVSKRALDVLVEHDWPGNVRELDSEIRRAVLVCPGGTSLQYEDLGPVRWAVAQRKNSGESHAGTSSQLAPAADIRVPPHDPAPGGSLPSGATQDLRMRVAETERAEIERALREAQGNRSAAARALGITRNGLALKMKRLGLE